MSYSTTYTESATFTVTHARHIAAKVATDLKRLQRFYGSPTDSDIAAYEIEVTELLKKGYLKTVAYGYKRDGSFIEPTLRYVASELQSGGADDDPGRVRPGADIAGATFYSYLTYTAAWDRLSANEQAAFKDSLPFQRTGASEPGVNGYLADDLTYSAGGRALSRATVRSF
ncbi:MAG TPA: hypothetical protein VHB25_12795 [Gemmatimonadaceae bacterium]|nr:hypothetical protein [Gemmatimonadaceae bacterium]